MGDFLVFGKEAFDAHIEGELGSDLSLNESLRQLVNKLKSNRGIREVDGRISMREPARDNTVDALTEFGKQLPEATLREIIAALQSKENTEPPETIDSDDAIDAAIALRLISALDRMVGRVRGLDSFSIQPKSFNTAEYFEEAHICDLLGLKIAAAVLCRAVLEDSLKKVIDPDGSIERELTKRVKPKGYISGMLDEALRVGRIDMNRSDAG